MRDDIEKHIRIVLDREVHPPGTSYASLPHVTGLVELLGAQRRVPQVLKQEGRLLIKRFLDARRRSLEGTVKPFRVSAFHPRLGRFSILREAAGFPVFIKEAISS